VVGFHKHDNESSCSIKGGEFLEQLSFTELVLLSDVKIR
jgi:hypothetical protein